MSHSTGRCSFSDVENQMSKIHQLNNFLCHLNEAVNWEMLRDALTSVRRERVLSQGGCPPFDVVLKSTYNLSDEATELQIRDQLSFREFLGLTRGFTVQVCENGVRNKPLTFLQRLCNNIKSRVRCRVEHVFGMQKKRMGDGAIFLIFDCVSI